MCMESAPFFIPSTSFCSLSFWFTSSCADHLIIVTTFDLIIFHSLGLLLQTQNSSVHKSFPNTLSGSISTAFTDLRTRPDLVGSRHRRLFVVASFLYFFGFAHGCYIKLTTLSFSIHVKLAQSYRIVSYNKLLCTWEATSVTLTTYMRLQG